MTANGDDWWVYRGTGTPHDGIDGLPEAPAWRAFGAEYGDRGELPPPPADGAGPGADGATARRLGRDRQAVAYQADRRGVQLVNLALHLRRPLLITGKPGVGKSTLAYAVAHELRLGPVLRWPITSRATLRDGLYAYDAIGRLHDAGMGRGPAGSTGGTGTDGTGGGTGREEPPPVGRYLRLGPLGTALLPWRHPRVLLIDEIDKSDLDLPNDLLNVFEEGEFGIPELARLGPGDQEVMTADGARTATVTGGTVRCAQFPFTVLTSNAEREFPAAFLRRCVRLEIQPPDADRLAAMVTAHLGPGAPGAAAERTAVIAEFLRRQREEGAELANDQLLNALLMADRGLWSGRQDREFIESVLLRPLNES
ncbi:AAA family ATPase [Streptomyces sp. CBMA29]|uniref:AAA family ATPase n=1 Tax=Streptomyces sp. CBMA29 TaxID=1896314 RepID=UPI001661F175|nr:MoxR family ATPase [Streptomyces sp. CBMA29]MBD0740401.1 AAA family ATPase [Streptomyces sp. CBMA29]